MKKITLFLLIFSIFSSVFCLNISAESEIVYENLAFDTLGSMEENREIISKYVDYELFKETVHEKIMSFESEIRVRDYEIPSDMVFYNAMREMIRFEMPELFQFDNITQYSSNGKVTRFQFKYSRTKEEYDSQKAELDAAIVHIVDGIKGNDSLSQVEKALLLHDRLILACEYDYTYTKGNVYDAIVNGTSVCEGYTLAYATLLNEVDIKNEYCVSKTLNHAWNIVYIGDIPYHVDVTWDDPSWGQNQRGVLGYALHENFLRSTSGIIETGHEATDFSDFPEDTTYDSYFWQNSETAFVLADGEIYYIDGQANELKKYGTAKKLDSVIDIWEKSENRYWVGNFSRLTTDGTDLYYSLSKAVYKYDISEGASTLLFEPELSGFESIYGLEYEEGVLYCDINTAPPFGNDCKELYKISYIIQSEEPETSIRLKDTSLLTENGEYLFGVAEKTTVLELLKNFDNYDVVCTDKDGNQLDDESICATGVFVKIIYDGVEFDSLEIIVVGDVDGNGRVNATDYMRIKGAFIGMFQLDGAEKLAADCTKDGSITSTDYLRIKSYFLGSYDLYK